MVLTRLLSTNPFSPEDVINKLIPNGIWPVITQLLTTIVLFIIVYRLLYKPVRQMLDKRAAFIRKNVEDASRDQKLAEAKLLEADKNLTSAKLIAQKVLKEAQESGEATKGEAMEEAKDMARRLKLQADEDIKRARLQAEDDVRKEIITVAIEASKQVLQRELHKDDDEKIIDDFVKGSLN